MTAWASGACGQLVSRVAFRLSPYSLSHDHIVSLFIRILSSSPSISRLIHFLARTYAPTVAEQIDRIPARSLGCTHLFGNRSAQQNVSQLFFTGQWHWDAICYKSGCVCVQWHASCWLRCHAPCHITVSSHLLHGLSCKCTCNGWAAVDLAGEGVQLACEPSACFMLRGLLLGCTGLLGLISIVRAKDQGV
eukprot:357924-Chlamydomonas_euryale.AAC.4